MTVTDLLNRGGRSWAGRKKALLMMSLFAMVVWSISASSEETNQGAPVVVHPQNTPDSAHPGQPQLSPVLKAIMDGSGDRSDAPSQVRVIRDDQQVVGAISGQTSLEQLSYSPGLSAIVGISGSESDGPIQVRVTRDGQAVAGAMVHFAIVGQPGKTSGTALSLTQVKTGDDGRASTRITLGDQPGSYLVGAYLDGSLTAAQPVITRVNAMESSWLVFLIIGLIGGLGLFLYGMNIAGDNLQKAWGEQMRVLLGKLTKTRPSAVLVGTATSAVLQSSSAASVMVVGFVSASMMTLTQAISVIMGTKVGMTITLQVLAFNISRYALAVVGLGAILIMAAGKREKMMHLGAILLGFGLIFFGLSTMSGAMKPLRGMPEFANMMLQVSESPGLAILVGTAFTAIIQSAIATIAICMALASQGLLSLPGALGLAIGSTVGTCATALLACLGSTRDGKRVAVAHLIFSAVAALAFWPLLGLLAKGSAALTSWLGSQSAAREIANGVTIYAVATAALFLPFVAQLEWLTRKILPAGKEEEVFGPKHINATSLGVPAVALAQAQKEVERMGQIMGQSLQDTLPAILAGDKEELSRLAQENSKLAVLEKAIRPFLAQVAQKGLSRRSAARERGLIYITEDFAGAGKLLTNDLLQVGEDMASKQVKFSEEGAEELASFHQKMVKKHKRVLEAVSDMNHARAEETIQLSYKEKQLERKLRDAHLNRLHENGDDAVTARAGYYLSVLSGLCAVGGKLDEVAEEVLREI